MRSIRFSSAVDGAFPGWIAVAAVIVAGLTSGCEKPAPAAAPTPEVLVAAVEQRDVPVTIELVGQSKGAQDVEIRARVEGYLETVEFAEGTMVRKGQASIASTESPSRRMSPTRRRIWRRPRPGFRRPTTT